MAKICTSEKTAWRQAWIENGLLELMQYKTFDEITVTDLCTHLKLSRRSFYRYFRDLEDVLDTLMSHIFQKMAIIPRMPTMEEIQKNYEFWLEHRSVLNALNRSKMLEKMFEYTLRYTESEVVRHYISFDEGEIDLSREVSWFAISGSVSLIITWYLDGFSKTPEEMARIAYRLLFSPILTKK